MMKAKKDFRKIITDRILMDEHGEWQYFDAQLKHALNQLPDTKYGNALARSYLTKIEILLKERNHCLDGESNSIHELKILIQKAAGLKAFLLALRISTISYRIGLIPDMARGEEKHSDVQARKGKQRWTSKKDELKIRNQSIVDDFKKTRLTINRFADKYEDKYREIYRISPRTIRLILAAAVGK